MICPGVPEMRTVAPPDAQYEGWRGSSCLGSLSTIKDEDIGITKQEYEEHGAAIAQ